MYLHIKNKTCVPQVLWICVQEDNTDFHTLVLKSNEERNIHVPSGYDYMSVRDRSPQYDFYEDDRRIAQNFDVYLG